MYQAPISCDNVIITFDHYEGMTPKEKVVKTVTLIYMNNFEVEQFVFAPPYEREKLPKAVRVRNSCRDYTFFNRGEYFLGWQNGDIPYSELEKLLTSKLENACVLYTDGKENAKFLNTLLKRDV